MRFIQDMSFRSKIMLMATSVAGMAILMTCLSIVISDHLDTHRQELHHAYAITEVVAANVDAAVKFGDADTARELLGSLSRERNVLEAWIMLVDGSSFAHFISLGAVCECDHTVESVCEESLDEMLVISKEIRLEGETLGSIWLRYDMRPMHESLNKKIRTAVLVMIASILLAILLAQRFQRYLSRPLLHLAETAMKVSENKDYSLRATKFSRDELGDLTDRFNEMLEQIEERDEALQEAHDDLESRVEQRTFALNKSKEKAEEAMIALRHKNDIVDLLRDVAVAANEATSTAQALQAIVDRLCEHTGWPVGHAYILGEGEEAKLNPTDIWHVDDPERFGDFKRITSQTSFAIGDGLPGRIAKSRRPEWILDVTADPFFKRVDMRINLGVRSAFGFPVLVGNDVVAVLEFLSPFVLESNHELLSVSSQIGTQLGRVFERIKSKNELQFHKEHLEAEISQRLAAEGQLRHDALHDSLTSLPNREYLRTRLEYCIGRSRKDPDFIFAILFHDIDNFKIINDSLGHLAGDELLVQFADRLVNCLQDQDCVTPPMQVCITRLGGDEFVVLLEDISHVNDSIRISKRIQEKLKPSFKLKQQEVVVSASIGIAMMDHQVLNAEDLLRAADTAMYRAKAAGKAQYSIFDQAMHSEVVSRLKLENDLRWAIEQNQFELHYQPIVNLESGRIVAFEALVRWNHPERGMIPPLDFIPLAEDNGLIIPLGRWVFEEACRQVKEWNIRLSDEDALSMSINVSRRQMVEPNFVEEVNAILRTTGLSSSLVKIEITESVIMKDSEMIIDVMNQFRAIGIELYMDDFGTGHSSLSCLHQFPFDVLKIDRAFVETMGDNREYAAIVHAIVILAHNLNMRVTAEGIEEPEQIAQMIDLDCDYGQGYHFSRPVSSEMAEAMIFPRPYLQKAA